ncbi:MAG TPA: BON domain-containing protein [Kineosporiaceae bacterium]|nr:BON domain-containing protein [Kineosporiaceae bacterium]
MSATRSTTTTTTTEGHYWVRRRRGAVVPVMVGVLGLAALGVGQLLPIRHTVESDLTARSEAALQAAGFNGVKVDFTGRDGTLTGSLGSAQDVARALAAVRGLDGVRVATAKIDVAGAGGGAGNATAPAGGSPTAPAALAQPQLTAVTVGGKVTLTGKVPSDDARNALVDAVTATFGAGNVVDQLTVDAGVSTDGVAGFGGVVTALGKASAATADLSGGLVTLTGTVSDAAAATAAGSAATALTGDAAKVRSELKPGAAAAGGGTAGTGTAGTGGAGTATGAVAIQSKLIALPRVTFETGSATLTPQGRSVVLNAARILKAAPGTKVNLRGYTDDLGDWTVNLELSTARANTVRLTLIANGVAAGTLTASGFSEDYPLVPNDSAAHRAMNRRVVFAVRS